jgi:hypothetical protein
MFTYRAPDKSLDAFHAVESYNGGVYLAVLDGLIRRHDVTLPREDAIRLRDFLLEALPLEAPEPAETPFPVGTRVRISETHGGFGGCLATVTEIRNERVVNARVEGRDTDQFGYGRGIGVFFVSDLTEAPLDEPGDPVGSVVYVTGDSADAGHGLPAGTEVIVDGASWYLRDGEYGAHTADGEFDAFVSSADLDVEPPFVPVPVGTLVRITSQEHDGLRHYLVEGSIAEVVRSVSRREESYTLKGAGYWPHNPADVRSRVSTQYVKGESFEVIA